MAAGAGSSITGITGAAMTPQPDTTTLLAISAALVVLSLVAGLREWLDRRRER